MKLHELTPAAGSRKTRMRVGRGIGSGNGKTSGRGHKGQNSRSGGGVRPGFEGGQMPLIRRVPKRGFTNIFTKQYAIINLSDLNRFDEGTDIDIDSVMKKGLVKKKLCGLKILGSGELQKKVNVKVTKISENAKKKIQDKGGAVEVIE